MRYIGLLIEEARRESDNLDFTDDTGLQDSEFLRWATSAQKRLVTQIQNQFPQVFQREKEVAGTAGEEVVDVPADVFFGARIQQVDYSPNGSAENYYPLKEGYLRERLNSVRSTPQFYIRRSAELLIQPPPGQAGTFRLTYQKKFARLDIRRGVVSAVSLNTSARTITSLAFDSSAILYYEEMTNEAYISIVDADGEIKMKAIPVTVASDGAVTVRSGFVFEADETIAVGDYAVLGKFTTTHSELVDEAEDFLVEYMIFRANHRDSNEDEVVLSQELKDIQAEIVSTYAQPSADIPYVPVLDDEMGYFDGV